MDTKSIKIEVLESTDKQVKVKMPFLKIPIGMTHGFFNKRVESGYFVVSDSAQFKYNLNNEKPQLQNAQ